MLVTLKQIAMQVPNQPYIAHQTMQYMQMQVYISNFDI